jgi:cobalamin biosynthesis Mg chelatase CobN
MALTATTNSGSQSTTQSPQTAGAGNNSTAQTGSVQPGTAANVLTSQNGISLQQTQLSTVSLAAPSATQTGVSATPKHHFNPFLLIVAVILFLVAAGFFWNTMRSVNSTTDY